LKKEINDEYALALLRSAVKIYSPSGQEQQLANFLAETMKELEFEVEQDRIGNVHGSIGSGEPTTLFCGHMDTVPGPIPVREADGYLHGRGTVDAKGPLLAMIVAAARHSLDGDLGKVLVVGVVEEERKGDGVKALVKQNPQIDYAVFGEPSGAKKITIGYKGSLHLTINVSVEPGHSSAPWAFPNSIITSFKLWNLISEYTSTRVEAKSHYREMTSCLTGIRGGSELNITPAECGMNIDIRIPIGLTVDQILAELREKIKGFNAENPESEIEIQVDDKVEPFETSIRSPIVQAFNKAIKEVYREPAKYVRKTGTGDMNILGHELKVPIVTYGPGDSRLDHSPHEKIDLQEFLGTIKIYQKALVRISEIHHKP